MTDSAITYVAFRRAALAALPPEAIRLTRAVTCSRCGIEALATVGPLVRTTKAAAESGLALVIVCNVCASGPPDKPTIYWIAPDAEMERVAARMKVESN